MSYKRSPTHTLDSEELELYSQASAPQTTLPMLIAAVAIVAVLISYVPVADLAFVALTAGALGIGALSGGEAASRARVGLPSAGLVSGLLSAVFILVYIIPAITFSYGARSSYILQVAGFGYSGLDSLVPYLRGPFVALACVAMGELLAAAFIRPVYSADIDADTNIPIFWVLYLFGIAGALYELTIPRGTAFTERGTEQGLGLFSLLIYCLPLATGIAIYSKHWNRRWYCALSLLSVAVIVFVGSRTPLILVVVFVAARLIWTVGVAKHPLIAVVIGVSLLYITGCLGMGMSVWRGSIRHQENQSLGTSILQVSRDPALSLSETGVDTLDGSILARKIYASDTSPHYLDPASSIVTLVPRQILPDKPPILTNTLTAESLGYSSGGVFFSGFEYLRICFRSITFVLLFFLLGGFVSGYVANRRSVIALSVLTFTVVTFYFGGGSFNFSLGLRIMIAYIFSLIIVRAASMFKTRVPVSAT